MSDYYVRRTGDDDYLEHSIFQKGVRGNHKYIARMNIGGKMRYFYDPRELAVFKAGGRAAGRAGRAIGGAAANVKRSIGRARLWVDKNVTGASAKRHAAAADKAAKDHNRAVRSGDPNARSRNTTARRARDKYESSYRNSLFGRVDSAMGKARKRIDNVGSKARNAIGNAAGQARRAGTNFAGAVSKNAYNVAQKAGKAIDTHITGASAKRVAEAERKRANTQMGKHRAGSQSRARRAGINAEAYDKKYRRSLFGRIDTAMDNASDWYEAQQSRAKRKIKKLKGKGKQA